MAINEPAPRKSFAEKLMSLNRHALYAILITGATIPAFLPFPVPNEPVQASRDFFNIITTIPEGSTVLIETDWTKSTRGESQGHMEALLRMMMRRNVKFAIYSCADPQAPQVARDVIRRMSEEQVEHGGRAYERWEDWIDLGYFPNAEAQNNAISTDVRKAFAGKTEIPPGARVPRDVWQSPVLQDIRKVEDFSTVVIVTASATVNVIIERLSDKVTLMAMVTGVMVPETQVYYESKQLKGMSGGLKGVYDMETLMGGMWQGENYVNLAKGSAYYPTLHIVLGIMMIAVIVGNIGMFLSRRSR